MTAVSPGLVSRWNRRRATVPRHQHNGLAAHLRLQCCAAQLISSACRPVCVSTEGDLFTFDPLAGTVQPWWFPAPLSKEAVPVGGCLCATPLAYALRQDDQCRTSVVMNPTRHRTLHPVGAHLLGLAWCFMGVALISDVFKSAIVTITSRRATS